MTTTQKDSLGISLCMIVRDEEHCIEAVLSTSRPHVEQIVLVDTGSQDRTASIASPYVDVLEHFNWIDDFSAARNFSLALANQPWILVLDADEVIATEDFSALRKLIKSKTFDGFYLTQRFYRNDFPRENRSWIKADPTDPLSKRYRGYRENRILRLFRNQSRIRYEGRIHETVDLSIDRSKIFDSNIPIHHYHENPDNDTEKHTLRNLAIQEDLIRLNEAKARDYLSAGTAHAQITKDLQTAAEYLTKALELGEGANAQFEALGTIHYRNGNLSAARRIYQWLYDSGIVTSALLNNLANLVIEAGDLRRGATLLEELLESGINDPAKKQRIEQNLVAIRSAIRKKSEENG